MTDLGSEDEHVEDRWRPSNVEMASHRERPERKDESCWKKVGGRSKNILKISPLDGLIGTLLGKYFGEENSLL